MISICGACRTWKNLWLAFDNRTPVAAWENTTKRPRGSGTFTVSCRGQRSDAVGSVR